MLTLRRIAMSGAAGAALLLFAAASAPGVLAATESRSRPASPGPGAASQLLEDIANAWKITQGSGVTVAVLSSGVDPNATGLARRATSSLRPRRSDRAIPHRTSIPWPPGSLARWR